MSFLASFYFDCTTDQESSGRPRKDLVKHYLIFTACSEVKAHANFSIVKIFAVFIFACEICEISTMQKFPAIWYIIDCSAPAAISMSLLCSLLLEIVSVAIVE